MTWIILLKAVLAAIAGAGLLIIIISSVLHMVFRDFRCPVCKTELFKNQELTDIGYGTIWICPKCGFQKRREK